jgi:hypothetical protein
MERRWPDGGEVRAGAKRSSKAESFFPKEIWLWKISDDQQNKFVATVAGRDRHDRTDPCPSRQHEKEKHASGSSGDLLPSPPAEQAAAFLDN